MAATFSGLVDPEPLPSQLAIRDLSDQLLVDARLQEAEYFVWGADPNDVRRLLEASSLGDMLLAQGEPLLPNPDRYTWPEDGPKPLTPDEDAYLEDISISTWSRRLIRRRIMPVELAPHFETEAPSANAPSVADLGDRIEVKWPDKFDWIGNVALRLWYVRAGGTTRANRANEILRLSTSFREPGELPRIAAEVAVDAGDGFRTIPRAERPVADDAEAGILLSIIAELNTRRRP